MIVRNLHTHSTSLHNILISCCLLVIITEHDIQAQQSQGAKIPLQEIRTQAVKRAPDTDLSRALLGGPTGTSTADIETDIAYIESALAKSGTHDPWAGRAFYTIGMGHWRLAKYQDALADFDACIKLPEPYSGIHLSAQQMRMMVLERTGDYNGAIAASHDILKTDGPIDERRRLQSTALLLRAQWQSIFQKSEGMKDAAISYQDFLEYEQKNPDPTGQQYSAFALRALGGALQKSGQGSKALKVYNDYLRKYPKSLDAIKVAMDRLAIIYNGVSNIPPDKIEEICSVYPINNGYGAQVLYQLGVNYFINDQYRSASNALHKAWHIIPDRGDTSYSKDVAGQAALLEMRCLNLAGLVFERDTVAQEIISHFKGTQYAQEAEQALKAYHADTRTLSESATSSLVKVILLIVILILSGFITFLRMRKLRA